MDQMSTPVRLLYYLNLKSKRKEVLENIAADEQALRYYIDVCGLTRGSATAKQTTKTIMKIMKEAA